MKFHRVILLSIFALAAILVTPIGAFAQSTNFNSGFISSNQCVTAPASGLANAGFGVTGTWTGTLTAYGAVGQAAPVSLGSVTADGSYAVPVAGYTLFEVCGNTVGSGAAFVQLTVGVNSSSSTAASIPLASCFASTTFQGPGASAPINTIGATSLIEIGVGFIYPPLVQDNLNNVWKYASTYGPNSHVVANFSYVENPITGPAQTFQYYTHTSQGGTGIVFACKNTSNLYPLAAFNGLASSGATSFQPGAVIPLEAGDLILTGAGTNGTSFTAAISGGFGFSIPVVVQPTAQEGMAAAWATATGTSAVNPVWNMSANTDWAAVQVVLRSSAMPPPSMVGPTITRIAGAPVPILGGTGPFGNSPLLTQFSVPGEMAFDTAGNLVFADIANNQIDIVNNQSTTQTLYNVAGICPGCIAVIGNSAGTQGFTGDTGQAVSGTFSHPVGIAINQTTNTIYIADQQNNRIRTITTAGVLNTVAGSGASNTGNTCTSGSFTGDGGAATSATFNCPQGVALDSSGNILIADSNNNRIRAVNTQGTTQTLYGVASIAASNVQTIVGTGTALCTGNGGAGTAAKIWQPLGMTVDGSNTLYWADFSCNAVRSVTTAGTVNAFAGNQTAGFGGDGGAAASAQLLTPYDVKFDKFLNRILIVDSNGTVRVVSAGIITTLAGNYALYGAGGGYGGDGGPARYAGLAGQLSQGQQSPVGVAPDGKGGVVVSDGSNGFFRYIK